jgi:hypothetical protein
VPLARKDSGLAWLDTIGIPGGIAAGAAVGFTRDTILGNYSGAATGAVIGGVVLSGASFLIDYGNGAAYKLDPAVVLLRLEPVPAAAEKAAQKATP